MYLAVLSSLIMPATCLTFGMIMKHAIFELKASPNDFTFAYFFIMSTFALVCSIVHFRANPGTWRFNYAFRGVLGEAINVIGCLMMNTAVGTGEALGPMFALQMVQSLMILSFESVTRLVLPNWMQLIGFAFGIVGGLVLIIPAEMANIWRKLTCRQQ